MTTITLQGTPATSVIAGTTYSFQPTLTPSNASAAFTIAQKPAWANFDSNTGALRGTPAASNIGASPSITITATDGTSTSSIGPFAITVMAASPPPPTGSATLTWTAPLLNTDGTALTDLAGYHIYYGTSAGALTTQIDVAGTTATTYAITGLAPGTYYFTVTAYSSVGTESAQSNVGTKTI